MTSVRLLREPINELDNPEWLKFIWACNEIDPIFETPEEFIDWKDGHGGTAEVYKDAYVIFRGDDGGLTVNITSRTDRGEKVITQVAKDWGYF